MSWRPQLPVDLSSQIRHCTLLMSVCSFCLLSFVSKLVNTIKDCWVQLCSHLIRITTLHFTKKCISRSNKDNMFRLIANSVHIIQLWRLHKDGTKSDKLKTTLPRKHTQAIPSGFYRWFPSITCEPCEKWEISTSTLDVHKLGKHTERDVMYI